MPDLAFNCPDGSTAMARTFTAVVNILSEEKTALTGATFKILVSLYRAGEVFASAFAASALFDPSVVDQMSVPITAPDAPPASYSIRAELVDTAGGLPEFVASTQSSVSTAVGGPNGC